jgi:hypothetical protein
VPSLSDGTARKIIEMSAPIAIAMVSLAFMVYGSLRSLSLSTLVPSVRGLPGTHRLFRSSSTACPQFYPPVDVPVNQHPIMAALTLPWMLRSPLRSAKPMLARAADLRGLNPVVLAPFYL